MIQRSRIRASFGRLQVEADELLAMSEPKAYRIPIEPLRWEANWPARQVSAHALRRVMRRKLPLASDHLLKLSEWIASAETQRDWSHPLKAFVKAIEAHGEIDTKDTALRLSLSDVARLFRNS